jgi:hypothetical protein
LASRLLAILDEEDGIGPSMASAILHFIQPEYFPIIDER